MFVDVLDILYSNAEPLDNTDTAPSLIVEKNYPKKCKSRKVINVYKMGNMVELSRLVCKWKKVKIVN